MKIQTALAVALLATTLNAYSSSSSFALDASSNTLADAPNDQAIQSEAQSAVAGLDATSDAMDVDNFGPGHGGPGGFHPPVHPGPGPSPGGFHPPVHPGPGPGHPPFGPHPLPPGHVYAPYPVHGGAYPWPHWGHPIFVRPVFAFEWARLHAVTCVAENSSGYQFPVTENGFIGFAYQSRMEQIEDAAIDRCFSETNGDQSCRLERCEAVY